MKKYILIALLTICSQLAQSQSKFDLKNLRDLNWMAGHWQRSNEEAGKNTTEFWEILQNNEMKGFGLTTNPDTIFYEDMKLKMLDQALVFQVLMKGSKEAVNFKVTHIDKDGFICENPENDFPKRIQYSKTAQGLEAIISNPGQTVTFTFIRSTKK